MTKEMATIIDSPANDKKRSRAKRSYGRVRNIDGVKYFSEKQIKMIRRAVRNHAEIDEKKKNVTAVKEWMVIDLLTSTGLRVSETANLRCGDLKLGYSESKIFVRDGKGQSAHVIIPDML